MENLVILKERWYPTAVPMWWQWMRYASSHLPFMGLGGHVPPILAA